MYSIYLIVHNDSGRVYVGQTKMPVDLRLQHHYRPSNGCVHIRNAVQHYGTQAFTCYEIMHGLTADEANEHEKALIREHNSIREGFNISAGGRHSFLRDKCRNGHNLELAGAMDSRGRCRECLHKNQRNCWRKKRNDPETWARMLAANRDYKRHWRAARQLQAA